MTSIRIYTFTNGAGLTSWSLDCGREVAENRDGSYSLWRPSHIGSWAAWCVDESVSWEVALAWVLA